MIYCDPVNDLVVVARWIPGGAIDGLLNLVIDSIDDTAATSPGSR